MNRISPLNPSAWSSVNAPSDQKRKQEEYIRARGDGEHQENKNTKINKPGDHEFTETDTQGPHRSRADGVRELKGAGNTCSYP